MKLLSLPSLLAAAVLSAVAVIPFLPVAKERTADADFFVELRLAAREPGTVQFFYDDGRGFRENLSARGELPVGNTPGLVRLPLPAGRYQRFRFDPIDHAGTVTLESLRIIDARGRAVRDFALEELAALTEVKPLHPEGNRLVIESLPGARDPQVLLAFKPALRVQRPLHDYVRGWGTRALPVFLVLAGLLAGLHFTAVWRQPVAAGIGWLRARPRRTVLLVAAAAMVASSYPVVFLGRSFVSPNLGSTLLYDQFPTLPGYGSSQVAANNGADIGAVMWQHVPFSMIQHDALRQGELPLWNRYNATGTPLLGQGQSMLGDPLNFLVSCANGAAWAWDLKYLAAKWLLAAGLGLAVLTLTGRLSAALLVSASSPFIGFFLYRVNHPALFSLGYSPWLLYCWLHIARATDWRATLRWGAGLAAANWMLLASGTVKEAYLLTLTLNFAGLLALLLQTAPWGQRLTRLALTAWVGLIFALVSAPLWLNFLNALGKAHTSYDARSAFQIQPGLMLGLFDELYYRPLTTGERVFNPSANFFLLLGVLYFLSTLRAQLANRSALALAVAALGPLALVFGLVSPGLISNLPFLGNVAHIDNSFSCGLIILGALLAGAGFATAAERLGSPQGRGDLLVVALLLFGLVLAYAGYGQAAHRAVFGPGTTFTGLEIGKALPIAPFVWGSLLACLAAAGLTAWVVHRALASHALSPAAALLLIAAALVFHWRHGLHDCSVGFDRYTVQPAERVDFHAPSEAIRTLQAAQAIQPGRAVGLENNFFPGWTGVYGLETASGPDAIANRDFHELCKAAPIEVIWDWRLYLTAETVAAARPFLDFLNVRHYASAANGHDLGRYGLKLVQRADLDIYESPTAWPRAFFTDRLAHYVNVEDLVWLIKTESSPFAAARVIDFAPASPLPTISSDHASRHVVPAAHYRLTANTTRFEVDATGPGVVVLTEAWEPRNFVAEVNGAETPVIRLNHAFKGVFVPAAGHYEVSIRYRPEFLHVSLGLFALGAVLAGCTGWLAVRRPGPARAA